MASKKGYEAIADDLRDLIVSGDLPPGSRVPSENELREKYGVGRDTASKALRILREEGLTESRQGAPTKVREFKPIRRSANKRLSASVWGAGTSMWDIDVRDNTPQVVDVAVDRIEAPKRVAAALDLPPGAGVVRRFRRYLLDGRPVLAATSYLPADIAADTQIEEEDTGPGGIYQRLADLGHKPTSFREEVRSRMPNKSEREALRLDRGTPVLLVVRTASTEARAVEVNEMLLDAASYVLDYVIDA